MRRLGRSRSSIDRDRRPRSSGSSAALGDSRRSPARRRPASAWPLGRLPVDHAVDEIDRVAVRREGHQDAAIADRLAALVDELGLEADRRAVGDDLQIMVGQPRQQRAARDVGDRCGRCRRARIPRGSPRRCTASPDCRAPPVKSSSTLCGAKSPRLAGSRSSIDGIIAAVEQRHPIIIGADMHPPLVGADRRGDVVGGGRVRRRRRAGRRRSELIRMVAIRVHCLEKPHVPKFLRNGGEA